MRAFERFNYPNFSLGIDHWTEQKAQENVADRGYVVLCISDDVTVNFD